MISLHEGKGSGSKKPAEKTFALKLTVVGCTPRIWRRLAVGENMWLTRLHDCIQIAFDWYDYQTHLFVLDDLRLGNPMRREDTSVEDDRDVTLADIDLLTREHMLYEYQFGEGWHVDVRVEKLPSTLEKGAHFPCCIGGERAGPPEDCGGLEAFHDMLACIKEPKTDLGREWLEWLGPNYDPAACDLEKINRAMRKLGK